MTDDEIRACEPKPARIARLGLSFCPEGITGLPEAPLPQGMIFVLDDRVAWDGNHLEDICGRVAALLRDEKAMGLVLDFEREPQEQTRLLALALGRCCRELGCRCAMPRGYGPEDAVFLPPPSCAVRPEKQEGRLWFEAAPGAWDIRIGPEGARCTGSRPAPGPQDHYSPALMARYGTRRDGNGVQIHLYDSADTLLARLEALGAELAIGLYRDWGMA